MGNKTDDLFIEHHELLRSYAAQALGNKATADDVSDTVALAYANLRSNGQDYMSETYTGECTATSFLFLCIKRKAWTILEQHKHYAAVETPEFGVEYRNWQLDHATVPLDTRIDLKAFLKRLNESDQKILDLYRQGYTWQEIADELGTSLRHIERRLQRVRKNLGREYKWR